MKKDEYLKQEGVLEKEIEGTCRGRDKDENQKCSDRMRK